MDHIHLFSRLVTQTTEGHWAHCAVQHRISVEVKFNALRSKIHMNSLKKLNLNY
jgi:hypothetical protein